MEAFSQKNGATTVPSIKIPYTISTISTISITTSTSIIIGTIISTVSATITICSRRLTLFNGTHSKTRLLR